MIEDDGMMTYVDRAYFYGRRWQKLERSALMTAALVANGHDVTIVAVDEQSAREHFDRVKRIIAAPHDGFTVSGAITDETTVDSMRAFLGGDATVSMRAVDDSRYAIPWDGYFEGGDLLTIDVPAARFGGGAA